MALSKYNIQDELPRMYHCVTSMVEPSERIGLMRKRIKELCGVKPSTYCKRLMSEVINTRDLDMVRLLTDEFGCDPYEGVDQVGNYSCPLYHSVMIGASGIFEHLLSKVSTSKWTRCKHGACYRGPCCVIGVICSSVTCPVKIDMCKAIARRGVCSCNFDRLYSGRCKTYLKQRQVLLTLAHELMSARGTTSLFGIMFTIDLLRIVKFTLKY